MVVEAREKSDGKVLLVLVFCKLGGCGSEPCAVGA
jgi:hypothetical protein